MPTISGTVIAGDGLPAPSRTVRAYRRDTGALLAEATTDPAVPGDASFASVSLLLHMDGTPGGTTFTDSSSNAIAVTPAGNTNTSSTAAKFGATSAYFDGTGDYLDVAANSALSFGTGDFTIEFFFKPDTTTGLQHLYDSLQIFANTDGPLIYWSNGRVTYYSTAECYIQSSVISDISSFIHVAVCRVSNESYLFVNGVMYSTTNSDNNDFTSSVLRIGARLEVLQFYFTGYIDDLRVTKGIARYLNSFTPPTVPYYDSVPLPGGDYTITTAHTGEVNVVCLDDSAGTHYNDLILRTTPV